MEDTVAGYVQQPGHDIPGTPTRLHLGRGAGPTAPAHVPLRWFRGVNPHRAFLTGGMSRWSTMQQS